MKDIDPTTFDLSVKDPGGGEVCQVSSAVLALATVPSGGQEVVHRCPQDIMDEVAALDRESAEVLATIRGLL